MRFAHLWSRSGSLTFAFALAGFASGANAESYTVLHRFAGAPDDGDRPSAGLRSDRAGNLYGTTRFGGSNDYGTIFKVTPDGSEYLLHSFIGGKDQEYPIAGVIIDQKTGDLYGTVSGNNVANCDGCGVIWKLTAQGRFSVLHTFEITDGSYPYGSMIRDTLGNLYGTTFYGGTSHNCTYGCGVVWKLAADGAFSVLHNFTGSPDGAQPEGRLARDHAGNLYGTTAYGGYFDSSGGYGTIFKVASDGTETVLYSFTNGVDNRHPSSGVRRDKRGNLYGTTSWQLTSTVFRLAPDGKLTTISNLGADDPEGDLFLTHNSGRIYGTTYAGGAGTVYELTPNGVESILHSFTDTEHPLAGVIKIKHTLYGTTAGGDGNDHGVVFGLTVR
ncbi:MAG: choice-of-anchor tandem repeat GloVer-containing protein [Rhizomicrobium sp.]|jgi:uncharacterized repeat protein (TIGR03803 family)